MVFVEQIPKGPCIVFSQQNSTFVEEQNNKITSSTTYNKAISTHSLTDFFRRSCQS